VTLEEIEVRQRKAVDFAENVLGDTDLADSLEDEDPRDYAERKHLTISNSSKRRMTTVANGDTMTKSELQDSIDAATSILEAAYTPEASREDMAAAIGDALNALSGDYDDEEEDQDSDDDR
jgi:hypothetical protein